MKALIPIALFTIFLGVVAHLGVFFLFKIEGPSLLDSEERGTAMEFVGDLGHGQDPVLREQALLRDSAPVFMPTRWNLASEMTGVASLRESTEVFASFSPRISLPESIPDILDPGPSPSPSRELLPDDTSFYLSLLGRIESPSGQTLPSRPVIKAERMGTEVSSRAESSPLPASLNALRPAALWNPARLFLQIQNGKVVGVPLISRSTGFTEWDQALQDHVGSLEFYSRLDDGYYRLTAYP